MKDQPIHITSPSPGVTHIAYKCEFFAATLARRKYKKRRLRQETQQIAVDPREVYRVVHILLQITAFLFAPFPRPVLSLPQNNVTGSIILILIHYIIAILLIARYEFCWRLVYTLREKQTQRVAADAHPHVRWSTILTHRYVVYNTFYTARGRVGHGVGTIIIHIQH